jgi:hypothetical protein
VARAQLDTVSLDEYRLVIQGRDAKLLADHLRRGIQQSSDFCKIIPPACTNNLGITRTKMPQILWRDTEDFLESMRRKGYKVQENATMQAGQLKATQREIFAPKVLKGLKKPPATQPLLVSSDDYLLDGHHRWAAAVTRDPTSRVKVHKIGLPIKTLLGEALAYDRAYSAQSLDDFDIPGERKANDDSWVTQALDELGNFTRSVGHSDEARDLLAVRLGVQVRGWRGRLGRGRLSDRDRAAIKQALRETRAY